MSLANYLSITFSFVSYFHKMHLFYLLFASFLANKLTLCLSTNRLNNENRVQLKFNDEHWSKLWYLRDDHVNIETVWNDGYTGRNVVVGIVNANIQTDHPELKDNILDTTLTGLRHGKNKNISVGTAFAGLIAAKANNQFCTVGIAYNSKLTNVRLNVSENKPSNFREFNSEADVYTIVHNHYEETSERLMIHEYSWTNIVKFGRNGLGSAFVVPSSISNGYHHMSCSTDTFVNSQYTIPVAGITRKYSSPRFATRCASIMTTAFTTDEESFDGIVVVQPNNTCAVTHEGSSFPAAIVAGIIALGIEANPGLDYRQIQNLIVLSSKMNKSSLLPSKEYWTNGAGISVSDLYGFGILNAKEFVRGAKSLVNKRSPDLHECEFPFRSVSRTIIRPKSTLSLHSCTTACEFDSNNIKSLEHIHVQLSIKPKKFNFAKRGMMIIKVKSPQGEPSNLLGLRFLDSDRIFGFENYSFVSAMHWFENPRGCWEVNLTNHNLFGSFILHNLSIVLTGINVTKEEAYI
ncbi:hypothetical protein ACOME3_007182 [Neoechinorhynchus agilis]